MRKSSAFLVIKPSRFQHLLDEEGAGMLTSRSSAAGERPLPITALTFFVAASKWRQKASPPMPAWTICEISDRLDTKVHGAEACWCLVQQQHSNGRGAHALSAHCLSSMHVQACCAGLGTTASAGRLHQQKLVSTAWESSAYAAPWESNYLLIVPAKRAPKL